MVHTRVRLEADGTGSRELTGRIRVQGESAIRELGLLRFAYASSFEALNIDYIRVRKPDGTVVSTPATDVQDLDSEVSRQAPMYTDEREEHIAVKTLAVGDTLEYHLVWTVHDALAPGHFWFYDNFLRDQICLDEEIVVDVPRDTPVKFSSGASVPVIKDIDKRRIYTLHNENLKLPENESEWAWEKSVGNAAPPSIQASSFQSWEQVGQWFGGLAGPQAKVTPQIQAKADELTRGKTTETEKIQALYEFVSLNIHYIGVSLGKGRYTPHKAEEVLANRYGDCKDKHTLPAGLLAAEGIKAYPALINTGVKIDPAVPSPLFDHLITAIPKGDGFQFVDTTAELGTLGYLWGPLRNKNALVVLTEAPSRLVTTPANPPGPNTEEMQVAATLDSNGTLDGKFRLELHGDTGILFRAAFRATSESRWTELMQQLSAGMGFGGTVANVSTGRPEAIAEPFWMAYSYHRPDYSDWKERQISLPFPFVTLPKIAEKRRTLPDPVQLGSPKDMTFAATVTLPKGTKPVLPHSADLDTEFAHYSAQYKFENGVLSGTRSLKTLVNEIPGSQRQAYSDFVDSMIEEQSHFIPFISGSLSSGMGMPEGG
jgi:transglutaminase-like putative cysteine protease